MSSGNSFPPGTPPQPPRPPQHNGAPNNMGSAPQTPMGTGPNQPPRPAPAPGYGHPQAGPQKKKSSKAPLFISLAAVAGVILLVVAGIIVVNVVNKQQHSPQALAQSYADAVNSGDMKKANEIAKVRVPKGAREELLDPRFIESSPDKVSNVKVGQVDRKGDTAQIDMSYTISGQEHSMKLHAEKKGKKGLFFDDWQMQGPQVQPVTLDTPANKLKVNGEELDVEPGTAVYAMYPGTYDIESPDSKFLSGDKQSISLGYLSDQDKEEPQEVRLRADVKDELNKEVEKLVNKKIDECEKSGDFEPKGCGFRVDPESSSQGVKFKDDVNEGDVHWKIEKRPKIYVSYSGTIGNGVYFSKEEGEVSFTADSKKAGKKAWKSINNQKFKVSGKVYIDGESVKIEDY